MSTSPQPALTDFLPPLSVSSLLKRRASPSFDCIGDNLKRMKNDKDKNRNDLFQIPVGMDAEVKFVDVLAEDLHCGCCSELVYKPVLVIPCQHFFCGR
jgi:E3 ubiquitin-protein ligase CHFR